MYFKSKQDFLNYIEFLPTIGMGSVGKCYLDKRKKIVIKIFHQFFDELEFGFDEDFHVNHRQDEILKFSNLKDETFIFATEIIAINDEVIGYVTDYVNAKSLYKQNPLSIELETLKENINKVKNSMLNISKHGILTFDMMYNILYGTNFYIIDHDDYSYSDQDSSNLFKQNYQNFCHELFYFLIEGYFDEFIKKYPVLNKMYQDKEIDILEFINLFKEKLSEIKGYEINSLSEAKDYLNKRRNKTLIYQRNL